MNQNPPPRGPDNPYFGAEGKDDFGQDPNTMQNQHSHYPPPGSHGHMHMPGGGYPPPGHYQYGTNPHDTAVMTTKDWLITLLIGIIPCINIIMLFVWAFSASGNHNRRNYARAYLLFIAIGIALYILLWVFLGAIVLNLLRWV